MEVVAAIVGSALTEPFRFLFGSIYGRIKNVFKIHSNYNNLEKNMESLLELKQLLDDDELHQRHLPRTQVQDWLKRVEKLQNEFDSVRSTITTNGASGCMRSLDCRLSNNIVKGLVEVKQLIGDGRAFENKIVGVDPAPDTVQYIGAPSIEAQPTASRNLAKMMDLLRNEEYKRIGVWGMGGVGKTTLVNNLNNELSKYPANQTFSIVIFVVVSQNATVESVQSKIAERLHLPMDKEESKESTAGHLYKKLKGKRFLLILDDMWEGVDLDAVGIPPLEDHIGSKIILTTRKFDVCQKMLTDIEFQIGRLSREEAWELFSKKVGEDVVNDDEIRPLAKAIVEECDGLPLAIIIVGASLRKKTEVALWNAALYALQKSEPTRINDVEEKIYKPLKWSYDSLKGEQLKSCFLFFCLFPEDFEIDIDNDNLVKYWLAEGLLDEQQNYEQLQYEVISIIDNLKDSCLLEKGLVVNTVKIHDVVRDVGVWIAKSSEDWCISIISSGISKMQISQQLLNCSDKVKRVSFMHSKITFLPDCNIPCPKIATLFLQGNSSLHEVPNLFLQGFQMLRTLNLCGTKIKLLPNSLLQLRELRALILRKCFGLSELPSLEALGKLQVLDCSLTSITQLPDGFEKLTSLRILNLSKTFDLRGIPAGKFCNLHKLEFLNMESSGTQWGTRNTNKGNAPFEDLLCLNQLIALYIDLKGIPCVTTQHASWFRKIKKFKFDVNFGGGNLVENTVFLTKLHFLGDEKVGLFLLNALRFSIYNCKGVDLMLDSIVRNSASLGPFVNLKELSINYCCIFGKPLSPGECVAQIDLLPNLEFLDFSEVSGLETISSISNFLGLGFTKLKEIRVSECYDLENLLVLDGTLQKFEKVEEISIERCEKLTEVFKNTSSDNFVPNLQSLFLSELPALEGICKANVSWKSLKQLDVVWCNMLLKLPLGIQNAEGIQSIRGDQHWWDELEWDNENFKERLQTYFKPWTS